MYETKTRAHSTIAHIITLVRELILATCRTNLRRIHKKNSVGGKFNNAQGDKSNIFRHYRTCLRTGYYFNCRTSIAIADLLFIELTDFI